MVNMTLSLSDVLHQKMKQFRDVKWTEVARRAIEERIADLEVMNKIASKSKLSSKDVQELSEKIKKAAAKKFIEA